MRALFDKIAKRFWTHAVRPEGARIAHRRSESILVLQALSSLTPASSAINRMSAGRCANSPTVTMPGI